MFHAAGPQDAFCAGTDCITTALAGEAGVKCHSLREIIGLQVCQWLVLSVTQAPTHPAISGLNCHHHALYQDSIRGALAVAHSCQAGWWSPGQKVLAPCNHT
jgi:hypothetical protein